MRTVSINEEKVTKARNSSRATQPWRYLVTVSRVFPSRHEIYAFALQERLPYIDLPLTPGDPDVVLNLQAAFERTWDAGPYPELLRYAGPPPGLLTEEEIAFCRGAVAAAS